MSCLSLCVLCVRHARCINNNPLYARNRVQWHFCATHVVFANVFAFVASHSSFELDWCRRRLQRNEKYHFHHRRCSRQNVISNWELMRKPWNVVWVSGVAIDNPRRTKTQNTEKLLPVLTCAAHTHTTTQPMSSESNEDDTATHKKVVNFLIHTMGKQIIRHEQRTNGSGTRSNGEASTKIQNTNINNIQWKRISETNSTK